MLREFTELLLAKSNLTFEQAKAASNTILDGKCSEVEIAGFLTAMAAKGETASEVAGMARAMRDHAIPVRVKGGAAMDIVGTGGDGSVSFNISTTSAFVIAGAGVKVAKHGNRAITSKCGSADVLAGLGVKIDALPAVIERCIEEAGMGFMFAPSHHPTMKYVQPIRKALGFRTVFNVLGPLANPAEVEYQIVGVAKPYLLEIMAEALRQLGVKRAMVVHGSGMDEFTLCGPTDMIEVRYGELTRHTVDYSDYGFSRVSPAELAGGDAQENVRITREILHGKIMDHRCDVVLFNAAAGLMLAGQAVGFAEGIEQARQAIQSGRAAQVLEKLVTISNS